jgi:hypothetical protein
MQRDFGLWGDDLQGCYRKAQVLIFVIRDLRIRKHAGDERRSDRIIRAYNTRKNSHQARALLKRILCIGDIISGKVSGLRRKEKLSSITAPALVAGYRKRRQSERRFASS